MTRKEEYAAYLKTPHWFNLRESVIRRDGSKCIKCGNTYDLQAHHLRYRQRFEDSVPEDLITVCRGCHEIIHGISAPVVGGLDAVDMARLAQLEKHPFGMGKKKRRKLLNKCFNSGNSELRRRAFAVLDAIKTGNRKRNQKKSKKQQLRQVQKMRNDENRKNAWMGYRPVSFNTRPVGWVNRDNSSN